MDQFYKSIAFFLLGTTVLNLFIAIIARFKTKHVEFNRLVLYYVALLSTYCAVPLLSQNPTQIAFAFFFQFIPCSLISQMLYRSRGINFNWKFFISLHLAGMAASSVLLLTTDLGFTFSLFPVLLSTSALFVRPIINVLVVEKNQSNWIEKCIGVVFLIGLGNHVNYAFNRLDASTALFGWSLSITLYQALSIFLPLLINLRREENERRNLEASIEKMSGINPSSDENLDELYRHLEIQITQKEQYLKDLSLSNANLEEEREMNDILIKTISHDLANPLTVINAYMEMLRSGKIPEDDREKIWDRMKMNMDHASDMIMRIRRAIVTRSQANLISVKPVDLDIVLHRINLLFDEKLKAKNLRLTIHNSLDEGTQVAADENALAEHILANILSNAVKFSFENSEIQINISKDDGMIALEVRDFGTGIKLGGQEKKSFVSTPGTNGEEGTGFGLIIMGYFVRKFGASVEYVSHAAKGEAGTSVILRLQPSEVGFFRTPQTDTAANIFS